MATTDATARLEAHKRVLMRVVAALLATCVALAATSGWLWWRGREAAAAATPAVLPHLDGDLSDAEIFTPVADPGLDFTFYPGLQDEPTWRTQVPLRTNWSGLREPRELERKPDGVFRVVLLGDSMVAAQAAPYEDGVAPQLERYLDQHAIRPDGVQRFEVRPVAVSGWNVFSAVRFAIHNLHVLEPDLCVLLLNRNDMDSGSGFVVGHTLVSAYDVQRLRSSSHASLASPSYFLRGRADGWGLVASDLIPESQARFEQAGREVGRLVELLGAAAAPFYVYLYDDYLAPGLDRTLPSSVSRDDVILGPAEVTENNLLPFDGHPDRVGHGHLAMVLASHAAKRGALSFDEVPPAVAYDTLATRPLTRDATRATFAVERMPAGFRIEDGEMQPDRGVRCVVGGCYATGVLSPYAVFALRCPPAAARVRVVIAFPEVPALVGGTTTVWIDGHPAGTVPMRGVQDVELVVPAAGARTDVVEVRLAADRYYTNPVQGLERGVWQAAAQAGRLVELRASPE
ncbi:MAG: SGNH/GDSL hydrolase family protein [Planctomycetes bacterium]|nr:SGNH/GDSL hydrolase family protein [Planctomycetota bacterium]